MSAKLKEILKSRVRAEELEVQPRRRSRDVVAELMVQRKAYYHATSAAKGRFSTQAELIVHLSREVATGERTRRQIAADAGIPFTTLKYLIGSGKVSVARRKRG